MIKFVVFKQHISLFFSKVRRLLPCVALTSSGGQIQWRRLRLSWLNTLPEGCQLVGPWYWGRTTIEWVQPSSDHLR